MPTGLQFVLMVHMGPHVRRRVRSSVRTVPSHLCALCCSDPHSHWFICFHLCFPKKYELLHAKAKCSSIWMVSCAETKLDWVSVYLLAQCQTWSLVVSKEIIQLPSILIRQT